MSFTRAMGIVVAAASLAACARSPVVVSNKSQPLTFSRQTPTEHKEAAATVPGTKRHTPLALEENARGGAFGVASFYTEGTQTASGEKFDTHGFTAAHRTLPFGTQLRVTNVATGRSVTVRVNDRGPFVPGRVVDVSYSAAERLGMISGGIAKVKLDVLR